MSFPPRLPLHILRHGRGAGRGPPVARGASERDPGIGSRAARALEGDHRAPATPLVDFDDPVPGDHLSEAVGKLLENPRLEEGMSPTCAPKTVYQLKSKPSFLAMALPAPLGQHQRIETEMDDGQAVVILIIEDRHGAFPVIHDFIPC